MSFTRNQLIILGAGAALVLFFVLLFTGIIPGLQTDPGANLPKVNLAVWGVFDAPSAFANFIARYQQAHQNVRVTYTQVNEATYEKDLLNALAAGTGPDIFMFHNTWLPKHYNKVVPLPATLLPYTDFQSAYPTVVAEDLSSQGVVYALPLSVDTLALLYNRDFFDKKSVALPPTTWTEFDALVPRLREVNKNTGEIIKAAAAIGGSGKSINRMFDLLSAILLQNGTQMTDPQFTSATFANPQGTGALQFYLQFANPNSSLYTWNDALHYSIDSFADGDTATIMNYAFQVSALKKKNPFLNLVVSPLPQGDSGNPVTFANYWGFAVSNKSVDAATAWDFVASLAYDPVNAREYRDLTGHPPALRVLINESLSDPELGVFAKQALIARTWPLIDNTAIEQIFSGMVDSVLRGQLTADAALRKAQDEVSQLMRRS